ncbi:type IV secretory system conjugative DNA transfer family protein [Paenarthrobacter sp. MSM-2-10-13]|jgi:type IV secretory pathway TraG/TraD family ATPase VirD4|uniref:type IV secretory system conjugative DNA transfer family protein n=1 Tax=Micrococcaceae TaxID=1268 RepID=UPI0014231BC5|nr:MULTISPECIES: type IV secretory system conjugative DNA transfer family protein [Micrococcaceae]NHW49448.1 type IV secretory system conjugative DNA transfer family protein [Paenarthrobacter sp. MSM-2-10-13]WRT16172.1 type IV secretory system conjugative DNA transfer family protein [Pseudarthrobacter sp. LT1]
MSATKRMSTDSVMKIGLAVIVIVLVVLGWVSAFLGELLTPTGMPWTDFSALSAKIKAGEFAWPGAATWILIVLAVLALVGAGMLTALFGGNKHRDDGLPRYKDLEKRMGKKAALAKAKQSLELPDDATEEEMIVALCKLDGQTLYVQHEDSMWVFAPQRSGKTLFLAVGIVLDAPGAVIATSTKNDLPMLTGVARQRKGDVSVFDLQDISGWPNKVRWNVITGCEDPDEALARAKAWAGAQPMGNVKNGDFFNSKASAVLGRFLHAAALGGKNIEDVVRWSNNFADKEPLEILLDHGAPAAFSDRLRALTTSRAGETVDSIQETLAGLLEPLSSPKAMQMLSPAEGEGFDMERFLEKPNTVYLLTDGERSPVAPLVAMFADFMFRKAQRISQSMPGGRLWPVLTMVLDEAPNVAAIPDMASALSDSGGRGIRIIGFSQSFAQNRQRWGNEAATAIRGTSSIRLFLPGLEELDELDRIARAAGTTRKERVSTSQGRGGSSRTISEEERPVIRGNEIQQLPVGEAFMHYSNVAPAVVKLMPWWERADADQIKSDKAAAGEIVRKVQV